MDAGESTSQNKRKERVKSIFDSDDSDEDEKAFGHSNSNDDDDDEDDDLRKRINEVCFNLSNEENKLEFGSLPERGNELNIPVPTFTMDVAGAKLDYDSNQKSIQKETSVAPLEKLDQSEQIIFPSKDKDSESKSSFTTIADTCESSTSAAECTEKDTENMDIEDASEKCEDEGIEGSQEKECDFSTNAEENEANFKDEYISNSNENDNVTDSSLVEKEASAFDESETETSLIEKETPSFDDSDSNTKEVLNTISSDSILDNKNKLVFSNITDRQEEEEKEEFISNRNVKTEPNDKEGNNSATLVKNDDSSSAIEKETESYLHFSKVSPSIEESSVQTTDSNLESKMEELTFTKEKNCDDDNDTKVSNMQSDEILISRSEKNNVILPSVDNKPLSFYLEELDDEEDDDHDDDHNDDHEDDHNDDHVEDNDNDDHVEDNDNDDHVEDNDNDDHVEDNNNNNNNNNDDENDNDNIIKIDCPEPEESKEFYFEIKKKETSFDQLVPKEEEEKELCKSVNKLQIQPEQNDINKVKEEMDIDLQDDIEPKVAEKETAIEKEIEERSEETNKITDVDNTDEVWTSVNIFEASKFASVAQLNLESDKANENTEFNEFNSDSEADINTTIDTNFQSHQIRTENKECVDVEKGVLNNTPQQSKKGNTISPWEAMKDGALFEEMDEAEEQSSDLQNAEMLKRKKVRVEDVFTDSEGDESPKKMKKIESNETASEKVQAASEKLQNGAEVSKKTKYKRERATSINLPAIMLAFEKGWMREVVYRSSSGIANKRADIYYYSPSNKKFRSRLEVEEYLVKNNITDLSLQNFSFFKEPLGVEEKYEKIRHASNMIKLGDVSSLTTSGTNTAKPLPKKRVRKPSTKAKESPPCKKAKTKEVVKKVMIKEAVTKSSPAAARKKAQAPPIKPSYQVPSMESHVFATHLYPVNPPLTHVRIITPVIRGEAKDKTFHCTPACEAGGGNVPNLQCVKCVCLFHSECCQMPPQTVSLIHSAIARFLCPNCYREESTTKTYLEPFKPSIAFEPLAFDPSSDSEDEGLVSDFEHPSYIRVNMRPRTPPLPPLPPLMENTRQIGNLKSPPFNVPLLQSPNTCSPSGTVNYPNQPAPLPQIIPNLPVAVPIPSSSSSGVTSYIIYQPITKNASLQQQQQPVVTPSQGSYKGTPQVVSTPMDSNQNTLASPTISPQLPEKKIEKPIKPQVIPAVRSGLPFFEDMCTAYQLIRKIFTYLPVPDLLNASCVCSMWRDLVFAPCYWSSIRLRNVCVKDWKKMVEFLDKRGTSELDLRKMVIFDGLKSVENKSVSPLKGNIHTEDSIQLNNEDVDASIHENNKDIPKGIVNGSLSKVDVNNETRLEDGKGRDINSEDNTPQDIKMNDLSVERVSNLKDENDQVRQVECTSGDVDSVNNVEITAAERLKEEEERKKKQEEEEEIERRKIEEAMKEKEENERKMKEELERKMKEKDELEKKMKERIERKKKEKEEMERKKKEEKVEFERKKKEKEDLERKKKEEKEKMEYLVSSVLNEHDYFGRRRNTSGSSSESNSSSSSSNSSSSGSDSEGSSSNSSDSEANLDITEEDVETSMIGCDDKEVNEEPAEKEVLKSPSPPQELSPKLQLPESHEEKTPEKPLENQEISPEKVEKEEPQRKDSNEVLEPETSETPIIEKLILPIEENAQISPEWEVISEALSTMKYLKKLVVGNCDCEVVETLIARCHQLTSFNFYNFDFDSQNDDDDDDVIKFDPSVLMQTRDLEELCLCSHKNFIFKSNFNFIKLPRLKMLTLKGLKTTEIGWPYLGIHLTRLRLSSISTFSHNNWLNISSMADLVELELDGGGSDHDSELCTALGKLSHLTKLSLFDWNIGSKLPHTLKRLHNIKYLHVIPAIENQSLKGVFAGRLMVVVESSKHLNEFIWGIQPQNIVVDETGGEKIYILNMKAGKETGSVEGEEVRSVSIDSLKGFIKCRIPQTKISVAKVSTNIGTWSPDGF